MASSPASRARKRTQFFGGLKLTFERGDIIDLEHNGEKLEIMVLGKVGAGKYTLIFRGPKTFKLGSVDKTNEPVES